MGKAFTGALAGIGAVALWEVVPGHETFAVSSDNPLAVFEHYHIGLASMILDRVMNLKGLGDGFGAVLIASELTQNNPFAIGKPTAPVSNSIGLALIGCLMVAYSGGS